MEVSRSRYSRVVGTVDLLVNYAGDRQESMTRFADLLIDRLPDRGVSTRVIRPREFLGRIAGESIGLSKWLGYIDKYIWFPFTLMLKRRDIRLRSELVHITDHSNALYASCFRDVPKVVTCHDLLAVRGAMGEDTDCPATFLGRMLQRRILRGLSEADVVCCISSATRRDLRRLLPRAPFRDCVVSMGIGYPYRRLTESEINHRIHGSLLELLDEPFIFHVGSSQRRKNREAVLSALHVTLQRTRMRAVFAGENLQPSQRELANNLGISDALVDLGRVDQQVLEALYNKAFALVFPSRHEGFGWPVVEAQACGCPVITSSVSSLPEAAGDGAILCHPNRADEIGEGIRRLEKATFREELICRGFRNARRFSTDKMVDAYTDIYAGLLDR